MHTHTLGIRKTFCRRSLCFCTFYAELMHGIARNGSNPRYGYIYINKDEHVLRDIDTNMGHASNEGCRGVRFNSSHLYHGR